jgi:hypothetical protein
VRLPALKAPTSILQLPIAIYRFYLITDVICVARLMGVITWTIVFLSGLVQLTIVWASP